jgi:hypothetical protein
MEATAAGAVFCLFTAFIILALLTKDNRTSHVKLCNMPRLSFYAKLTIVQSSQFKPDPLNYLFADRFNI